MEKLGNEVGKKRFTLLYYQWVCLLFFIQALLFYTPRYLWKTWEGNHMNQILQDLCGPLVPQKWSIDYKEKLTNYLLSKENHDALAYRFAGCELLNFFNLIFQGVFMDWYLDGKFARYGYEVATKPWPVAYNAVFPKRTKCSYTRYGPSGSIENKDSICVLPLNVLNEKFFLILWYWLIFMFVVTVAALIYRVLFLTVRQFRSYLLMAQVRSLSRKKMRSIGEHLSCGQFFVLYNIGKGMNPIVYKELLLTIFENMEVKKEFSES